MNTYKIKMKNKILIWTLFFISSFFLFHLYPSSIAYTDNELQSANYLGERGYIVDQSSDPSKYRLNDTITRGEIAKVMIKLSGLSVSDSYTCRNKFNDVSNNKPNDWVCKYVEKGLDMGYLADNPSFRPSADISKIEALKMIFKGAGIEREENSDWKLGYVNTAVNLGITTRFTDYDAFADRGWIFESAKNSIEKKGGGVVYNPTISASENIIEKYIDNIQNEKFTIKFAGSMDQKSVEKNIKIYPELENTMTWISDDTLEIEVTEIVDDEIELLVNVLEGALTGSGEIIGEPIVKKFKVDGVARVDFVSPSGPMTDLTKNITVRFSKPIVPLTNLDNQPKCPIEITPELPGKCVWITTSTFQFRPEGGFPIGARYDVLVPSGIDTIAGDQTVNSMSFEISTPAFSHIKYSKPINMGKDEPIRIIFNAPVDLNKIKNNFSINGFNNSELDFKHYEKDTRVEGQTELKENIVEVFPKYTDWGYDKKYTYTIGANMTSKRGNVSLGNDSSQSINIHPIITGTNPFIIFEDDLDYNFVPNNRKHSDSQTIITKEDPYILFNFYEEIPLDRELFYVSRGTFSLEYLKRWSCEGGECDYKEDKKAIIVYINATISSSIDVKFLASKISNSEDKTIKFTTSTPNKLLSYRMIDYKTSCAKFEKDIEPYVNYLDNFDYGNTGKVYSMYKVIYESDWEKCNEGEYRIYTKLNPSTDYSLTIKNDLLDHYNYSLDKDYQYSFTTPTALDEDKRVNIFDSREFILVPTSVKPLGVAIQTVNLDKVNVEVCEGDFDMTSIDYIKNTNCVEREVEVNNLGFDTNFSVLDLTRLFGRDFSRDMIKLTVSKLDSDKTEYEKKDSYTNPSVNYIISDKSVVWKTSKDYEKDEMENLLWITDMQTGEVLEDKVAKIENYTIKNEYNSYGTYLGKKAILSGNLNFSYKSKGVYEVDGEARDNILITLISGEKVLLNRGYSYYGGSADDYIFVKTDRPLYKAGDKVYIKGIARKLTSTGYDIRTGTLNLILRDYTYEELLNTNVTLSENGSFEYEYELAEDASLGNYNLTVGNNYTSFAVEEYEKPDFKITSEVEKEFYQYGENSDLDITGEFYLGAPLSNGQGSYRVNASTYYFYGGKTKGYIWGKNEGWWLYDYYNYSGNNFISSGNFSLDSDGYTSLKIPLDTPEVSEGSEIEDKVYDVSITVADPNTKKSISTNSSFKVLRSKNFVGMKFDKYYYEYGDDIKMDFVTVDTAGNKVGGKPLTLSMYKITYEQDPNTYEYIEKEEELLKKSLTTSSTGISSYTHAMKDYGRFRVDIKLDGTSYKTTKTIYVSGKDIIYPKDQEHTLSIISDKNEYDVGDTAELVIQSRYTGVKALVTVEKLDSIIGFDVIDIDSNNQIFKLPIKKEFLPNFEFKAFIIKDVENSEEALVNLKSVRLEMQSLEQEIYNTGSIDMPIPYLIYDLINDYIYPTIPVGSDIDKDTLEKLYNLKKKENELLQEILPNYLEGSKPISINLDPVKFDISVDTDKISYLPGDKQVITLNIKDNKGNPVNGEATLAIVDEALLALKGDNSDIVNFFYSEKGNSVRTSYNTSDLIKRLEFILDDDEELERNDSIVDELDNRVFGNTSDFAEGEMLADKVAEEAPMAKTDISGGGDTGASDGATKLREDFKDLAHYRGTVSVVNGVATITVPKLPDNLTTWMINGFAFDGETRVGQFTKDFKVQKKLAMIPSIPRFFVSGDEVELTATVVNNTSADLQVEGSITFDKGLTVISKDNKKTIKANSQGLLSFRVKVDPMNNNIDWDNYGTSIIMKVVGGGLEDAMKLDRKIIPYSTPEYTFTNGNTEDLSYEEKIYLPEYVDQTQGKVDITLGASILTNLMDEIDSIASLPSEYMPSTLIQMRNASALKRLYTSIDEEDKYYDIEIEDYLGNILTLDYIVKDRLADLKNYQQPDGGMSYSKECYTNYWRNTCSSFWITQNFLATAYELEKAGYTVDYTMVDKAMTYYKKELEKMIKTTFYSYPAYDFYILSLYDEKDFVNKYNSKIDYGGNIAKLYYISMSRNLGINGTNVNELIKLLENSTLIEARGTLLPARQGYHYWRSYDNSISTALGLKMFIGEGAKEKLLIENMARWIVQQKNTDGSLATGYTTATLLDAITDYIEYTGELEGIDFTAKGYLNNNEIISAVFNIDNRFKTTTDSYSLKEYINFGEDNSLGFEKTGTGKLYYDVGLRYFLPIDEIAPRDEGIIVSRNYYDFDEYNDSYTQECYNYWWLGGYEDSYYSSSSYNNCNNIQKKSIESVKEGGKGDYLVGVIEVIVPHERNNVIVNNYIPSGAEILNVNLDTTASEVKDVTGGSSNRYWYGGFDHVEVKDDRLLLYADRLYAGTYKYTYVIRLNQVGIYHHRPATAEETNKPEIWGRTRGEYFEITQ